MDQLRDNRNLLSIKVLRLARPSFVGPLPITCDNHDMAGGLWSRELENDVTAEPGLELLSLGNFLRLPQGFGNIYLGETFSCYICIQNGTPLVISDVSVKVDLQTITQRFSLVNDRNLAMMQTNDTIDIIINHELREMGKHMLVCSLTYTAPQSEPVSVERFFKFQVKKPLDVHTKLYNAESDEVFLEAQVGNITSGAISLEKVMLEPSPVFECKPMDISKSSDLITCFEQGISISNDSKSDSTQHPPSQTTFLDTECSHQFLYRLIPKIDQARSATGLGKLDIVWRSTMGEKGRLQTSHLQRQAPHLNELRLSATKVPENAYVDKPFVITFKISNMTKDRSMRLELDLGGPCEGYCWMGFTKTVLGLLEPSQSRDIQVTIFPLRTGLLNISGIKLFDSAKAERFSFKDLVHIFIQEAKRSFPEG